MPQLKLSVQAICFMILVQDGLSAIYTGCKDYVCGGYKHSDNFFEWQQCINNNKLYNPDGFGTNSFCTYCSVEEDGSGPCYCATKSECYSWWYGFGITMIVIGFIVSIIIFRKLYIETSHIYHSIYNKDPTPEPDEESEPEPEPEETECDRCGGEDHRSVDCPHYSQPRPKPVVSTTKAPELSDNQLFMRRINWSKVAGC